MVCRDKKMFSGLGVSLPEQWKQNPIIDLKRQGQVSQRADTIKLCGGGGGKIGPVNQWTSLGEVIRLCTVSWW